MRSFFNKLFLFYMIILISSLMVLTMGLTKAFNLYFESQKKDMLVEQGEKIVKVLEQSYYWGGFFDKEKLNREIEILDEYLDASFIYFDSNYKISIISNDIDSKWLGQNVASYEIKEAVEGNIIETEGCLGGIFKKPVLTVGYPVTVNGKIIGAIFMNAPLTELQKMADGAYKIILYITFAVGVIGFIVIYIYSKKITKPLREMNNVAKVIANGHFEKRISVKGSDEIAQLAQSLNDMAGSLNEQEKRRREFISNISHDLRSPLTSMKGFVQAIIDGTIPPEKQEHYLKIVLDESERLESLANNIININNLENKETELNLSDFDINELIKKIVFNFETRVSSKKINLRVTFQEKSIYVRADYEKIQRVIYNLLDNAVKFTDVGGEIFLETNIKDKKALIYVRDNGRGISEDDKKRIFDRFYKADISRGEDKKGSGLGLSIVKNFIVAHGEIITLNSELNKGSEFYFSLPLVKKI